MKYTEFHRRIKAKGWKFDHAEGSLTFTPRAVSFRPQFPFMEQRRCPNHYGGA